VSRFEGRTALVTSASRGIGLATAAALLAGGANVCLTARRREPLEAAAATLGPPERVLAVAGDSGDPAHRAEAVERTLERFGALDLLVNNTGVNDAYAPLLDTDLDAVRSTFETNVVAALDWVARAHRASMGARGGAVVNVASIAGLRSAAMIGAYAISKAAVVQMTRQLASELGPQVRVNAVAPAVVRTRFASALFEDREDAVAAGYPLRRLGAPEDVAGAVAFLLSDEAAWITGETLLVDGGLFAASAIDGAEEAA